jgi:predicted phage terminase large subunit-like protein
VPDGGFDYDRLVNEAKREKLRRKAQNDLIAFTQYTYPKYKPALLHRAIAKALKAVLDGKLDRLMILTGPRHGKSELCSKRFPAFALGHKPDLQFISTSANMDLARQFGGNVRDIIDSPEYAEVFPHTRLQPGQESRERWGTTQNGIFQAFGTGGRPIGYGGDLILVDDPFGSMEDAESETVRRKVHDWFSTTLYHRLQPGGAMVLINHRMHEEDLSGHLLEQQKHGGDEWFVLSLPTELNKEAAKLMGRKEGEALWPVAFPLEALHRIKNNIGTRAYSSLYLQDPAAAEVGIFKRDWFNLWPNEEELPVFDFVIQSYDTAYTDKTSNDPTAMSAWGVFTVPKWLKRDYPNAPDKGLMLIDCWEDHIGFPDLKKRMHKEWQNVTYGATWQAEDDEGPMIHDMNNPMFGPGSKVQQGKSADIVLIEDKGSGQAVRQMLQRAGVPVVPYSPGKQGKAARGHAASPLAEAGAVWVPESKKVGDVASWAAPLIAQLCTFTREGSIKHDDLFDSATQAMNYAIKHRLVADDPDLLPDPTEGQFADDEPSFGSMGGRNVYN